MALFFIILTFFVSRVSPRAHRWLPETYPNPRMHPSDCGRKNLSSWVCDPDELINFESANALDAILAKIAVGGKPFAQAPCGTSGLEGFRMAVALMHRFSDSNKDPPATARSFAHKLQDAWGVGDPSCDNGVLLLLSALQDQFVVAAGAAVEALLPGDTLANIVKEVRVDIEEGRYGAAIELAATRIGLALAVALQPHDSGGGGSGDGGGGGSGSSRDGAGHSSLHLGLIAEELLLAVGCISAAVGALYQQYRRRERVKRQYEDCRTTLEGIRCDHLTAIQQSRSSGAAGDVAVQSTCSLCLSRLESDFESSLPAAGTSPLPPRVALTVVWHHAVPGPNGDGTDSEDAASTCVSDDVEAAGLRTPLIKTPAVAATDSSWRPAVMFPCKHVFCEPCIAARFDRHQTMCPNCGCNAEVAPCSSANTTLPAAANATITAIASDSAGGGGAATIPSSSTNSSSGALLLARLRELWEKRRLDGDGSGSGGGGGGGGHVAGVRLGPSGRDDQFPLLIFRLLQLQRLYPQFLSADMTDVWERDLREGRDLDLQQMRNFERRDPARKRMDLVGSWRIISHEADRLRGLRIWRGRR